MSFTDIIPGAVQLKAIEAVVVLVLVLSGAGWLWWQFHELKVLKAENAVLITNNKTLQENNSIIKSNLITCESANSTSAKTITDLLNERADAKTAVQMLAVQKQYNAATIAQLQKNLNEMKKTSGNDGPIAPVLKEAVRGIQTTGRTK